MPAPLPEPVQVRKAVEVYLGVAYDGAPPADVQGRVDTLGAAPDADFFANPAFERDRADPSRYRLRLGNRLYPHMKMAMEPSPDGAQYLFRADTHDRHICPPPTSKEYGLFRQLMDANQALAQAIEARWEQAGVPTFKLYLRQDLARRRQAGG
jgi:hypothetical protein